MFERQLVPANAGLPPPPPPHDADVDFVLSPPIVVQARACVGKRRHEDRALAPLNVPLFVATDLEDAPALVPLRAAFPWMVSLRKRTQIAAECLNGRPNVG